MSRFRKLVVLAFAAMLAALALVATPAQAITINRLSGCDRYETAVAISRYVFSPGVPRAFVAVGTNFPDALAGGAAAGATKSPLLLTPTATLPATVRAELVRLRPAEIVVLGGHGVVSEAVANQLREIAPVQRLAGADRFATAAAIAESTFQTGTKAYVAVGTNFPDALAGSALAKPVFLTQQHQLPQSTRAALVRLQPSSIVVLGGVGAVSDAVLQDLGTIAATTRISGLNRHGTAAAISAAHFGVNADTVYLATGANFPDALAGSAAAAMKGAPLLLATGTSISPETVRELQRLNPGTVKVFGGAGAVSEAVLAQLGAPGFAPPDPYAAGNAKCPTFPLPAGGAPQPVNAGTVDAARAELQRLRIDLNRVTFTPERSVATIHHDLNYSVTIRTSSGIISSVRHESAHIYITCRCGYNYGAVNNMTTAHVERVTQAFADMYFGGLDHAYLNNGYSTPTQTDREEAQAIARGSCPDM